MPAIELSIITLNIWGIPFVSSDKEIRIRAIANEINKSKYDIVALQEVWSENDYRIIQRVNQQNLPYSHYFYSGVLGAGLCVFSKYPIVATLFHAWPVNGYFHRIQHGDWFGGKGVGLCRIFVQNKIINIYNAHLHAEYDSKNDEYKTHRAIQAFDTAQFIQATRGKSIIQILAGDLNCQPNEISYKTLIHTSKMIDCCPYRDVGTNESPQNSYTDPDSSKKNPTGLRIDHIFVRTVKKYEIRINEYSQPFPIRVPEMNFSFSDHEAVHVKLSVIESKLTENNKSLSTDNEDSYAVRKSSAISAIEALKECVELCDLSLKKLKIDRNFYCRNAILIFLLITLLIDLSVPYGLKTIYLIVIFILFASLIFCLFMATIWNYIEANGTLSAKNSMQIAMTSFNNYPNSQ